MKYPDLCISHYGQVEDRDSYRLKDRNNAPVLCFWCGTSALASTVAAPAIKRPRRSTSKATSTIDSGKPIVSCDYCSLHWHLDCLDPPLAVMPSYQKKWMCPNHADQTLVRFNKHHVFTSIQHFLPVAETSHSQAKCTSNRDHKTQPVQ